MKNTLIRFAGVAAVASALMFAQTPAPSDQTQPPAGPRWNRGQMFDRMAQRLNLTDAQRQQAQSILDSARESSKPVFQQIRTDRQALRQAVKTADNAQIDRLSANLGTLTGQMTATRTKAFAQVYALLTPEQRAQADQIAAQRHDRFMRRHQPAPSPAPGENQ